MGLRPKWAQGPYGPNGPGPKWAWAQNGTMVPWCRGAVVPWYRGTVVLVVDIIKQPYINYIGNIVFTPWGYNYRVFNTWE